MSTPLIGGVFERKPSSSRVIAPSAPSVTTTGGFPTAKHRSQSTFARARLQANQSRPQKPPPIQLAPPVQPTPNEGRQTDETDDWRTQMADRNTTTVATMTDEERQRAVAEITDTLGDNVRDLIASVAAARARKASAGTLPEQVREHDLTMFNVESARSHSNPPIKHPTVFAFPFRCGSVPLPDEMFNIVPGTGSRPQTPTKSALRTSLSRSAARNVTFADLKPQDVHVYESQPSSPKRVLGLLAPRAAEDGDVPVYVAQNVPLASEPRGIDKANAMDDEDPESIRTKFFPNESPDNPSLEWIKPSDQQADPADNHIRFDLRGKPIPTELIDSLPSHLGLHHHAQGSRAGYTLEDLFTLSRSTVPAQRASMLGVLTQVLRRIRTGELDGLELGASREQLRESVIQTATAALPEATNVGVRAVDALVEALVEWDADALSIDGVWQSVDGQPDPLANLAIAPLINHISRHLSEPTFPPETLYQLLTVLHRLSRHSLSVCATILETDGLVQAITRLFLPVHPQFSPAQPNALVQLQCFDYQLGVFS